MDKKQETYEEVKKEYIEVLNKAIKEKDPEKRKILNIEAKRLDNLRRSIASPKELEEIKKIDRETEILRAIMSTVLVAIVILFFSWLISSDSEPAKTYSEPTQTYGDSLSPNQSRPVPNTDEEVKQFQDDMVRELQRKVDESKRN